MKKSLILILFLCVSIICFAQTFQIANYNRPSVAVLAVSNNVKYSNDLSQVFTPGKSVELSGRYFQNPTRRVIIQARNNPQDIISVLKNDHYSAQSLMPWRNLDTLVARASYNLTVQQRNQLASSVRGIESGIQDERWSKHLLKSNYILVLYINDMQNIQEVYSKRQLIRMGVQLIAGASLSVVKESKDGYVGKVTAYLYHITMNDIDYAKFWQQYYDDDDHLAYPYGLELVATKTLGVNATWPKEFKYDNAVLLREFVAEAADKALLQIGNTYLPITPKGMVISNHPVRAELGTKEGLRADDLMYVYELREASNGDISYKRKGTYRVKQVVNNEKNGVATSTFYNINWGRAKEGMVLVPHDDKGYSVSPGMYVYPKKVFRVDFGFSLARLRHSYRSSRTKLLVNVGYSGEFTDENPFFGYYADMTHDNNFRDANGLYTVMYGIGFQQDLYVLPFAQLSPYFLVMIEHSWYKNKDMVDDAMGHFQLPYNYGRIIYPQFGLKVPINLTYYIKLVPEISYAFKLNTLSVGVGLSSENHGDYPVSMEKSDRVFAGCSLQLDF